MNIFKEEDIYKIILFYFEILMYRYRVNLKMPVYMGKIILANKYVSILAFFLISMA